MTANHHDQVRLAFTDDPNLRAVKLLGWMGRRELEATEVRTKIEAAGIRVGEVTERPTTTQHAWIDKALLRGIPITGANVGGAQRYTRPGDCTRCARMGSTCPACATERRRPDA